MTLPKWVRTRTGCWAGCFTLTETRQPFIGEVGLRQSQVQFVYFNGMLPVFHLLRFELSVKELQQHQIFMRTYACQVKIVTETESRRMTFLNRTQIGVDYRIG